MRSSLQKRRIIAVLAILIIFLLAYTLPTKAQESDTCTCRLAEGDFIEYHLRTSLITLWNFTLENNMIMTLDDMQSRSISYTPGLLNEISIKLDVIEETNEDTVLIEVSYYANPIEGYKLNHAVLLKYSPESGSCSIMNGTLEGYSGILRLFFNDEWSQIGSIVSLLDRNVTLESISVNHQINVMDSMQFATKLDCIYFDAVNCEMGHSRFYDSDSGLLTRARGINDRILLGLANISYADGTLELVATNIDIGIDSQLISISVSLGILVVCIIALLIWRKWRKSKKPIIEEPKQFHADVSPESAEPPRLLNKTRKIIQLHRKSLIIGILLFIILGPMFISLPLFFIQRTLEEPPAILYKTSSNEIEIKLGEWRYGEISLSSPPSGKENYVTFEVSILDGHNCPSPLLMYHRISRISVQDFTDMLESENETISADGLYINEGQNPGVTGQVLNEGQYLWYYSFITPYHNTTSRIIEAEITISLTVQNPS